MTSLGWLSRHVSVRALVAVGALVAVSCSSQGGGGVQVEKTSFLHSAIQGGSADYNDTGAVGLYIYDSSGNYPIGSCSGTLIAPNLVLTARHCVADTPQQPVCGQSTFGSTKPASRFIVFNDQTVSNNTAAYEVKQVLVDPTGNGVCGHDIALLILKNNISSSVAKPIEPRVFEQPHINEVYSAIGYGNTCPSCNDGGHARMRRNNLKVLCVGSTCGQPSYVDNAEWVGGDGVCAGDSGGPSVDSSGRQIGVASRGGESNGQCVQSIYERLDSHKDFIINTAITAANAGGYPKPSWADPNGGSGGSNQTCDDCQAVAVTNGGQCTSQASGCQNNSDCNAWISCMQGCSTATCQAGCFKDHPQGAQLYGSLDDCICDTACTTECSSSCTTPTCGFDVQDTTCNTCLHSKCCSEGETCAAEMSCSGLLMCIQACGSDDACQNKCESDYSAGVNDLNSFMNCLSNKCGSECGVSGSGGAGGSGGVGGSGGATGGSGGATGGNGGSSAAGTGGNSEAGSGGSSTGGVAGAAPGGAAGQGQAGSTDTPNDTFTNEPGGCGCTVAGGGDTAPLGSTALLGLVGLGLLGLRRRQD